VIEKAYLLAFRAMVLLYPRAFRETYADDMESLFLDRLRESRAPVARARFWLRTSSNIALTACAERWARRRSRLPTRFPKKNGETMSGLLQDARYALRLLRRQPSFAIFVILTLAVGIAANSAVFSVVNGVALRPLPFDESERLVAIWGRFDPESGFNFPQFVLSNPEYIDYRNHSRAVGEMAAYQTRTTTVSMSGSDPERVPSARVTSSFFTLLRVQPSLGRTFTAEEDSPSGAPVAVLSHGYWQARFGGDSSVIGRVVSMNGVPTQVIGVMPRTFAYPQPNIELWLPLRLNPANPGNRKAHGTRAIGRLAPGVELSTARAELQSLMADWKARYPDTHTGHYLFIRPLLEDVAGTIRPALFLLLAATGFVLLIVCANIASVVMARGETRTREMAIRGALGAERRRLIRLSMVESAILGVIAGAVGLALGYAGVRVLLAIDPSSVPRSAEIGLDMRMVSFAAAASLLSAALFGLLPAMRGARADLQSTLRESSQAATAGTGRQWFRRGLVVAEVGLSVVLVIGAGLMLRSFSRLLSVDIGFRPEGLVTAAIAPPQKDYQEPARVEAFYSGLIDRLRTHPGITAVSAGTTVPLWSDLGVWDFEIEGKLKPSAGALAWNAAAVVVRPGYLETLGVPLLRGRSFTPRDDARAQLVAVINDAMARTFFAGEDPIGRRIRIAGITQPDAWMTIVGISGNVKAESLEDAPRPAYYFLQGQAPRFGDGPFTQMSIVARTAGSTDTVIAALRSAVRELDPSVAVYDVQTAETIIDRSVARRRFTSLLLGLFALIGLVLGASGIYGVLAYTVARRTQEIGIRRALGAPPALVAREVVTGGLKPVLVGLVLGLIASYWTSSYWSAQLFNVSGTDPQVYLGVAIGVLLVGAAATIVPMRRALRVSPIVALRAE
jgi:putative ABC transport system permease protein